MSCRFLPWTSACAGVTVLQTLCETVIEENLQVSQTAHDATIKGLNMPSETLRYWLFPYTALSDRHYRHLALFLPHLTVLQISRPPAVPLTRYSDLSGWPAFSDGQQLEKIALSLKGYQEFAAIHGENAVMASLSHEAIAREFAESRFRIETELHGRAPKEPDPRETALLEAAVFLELARDLDEREMDLEANITEAGEIEGRFREILGISDDEDALDRIDSLSPSLTIDATHLSFMLPQRIQAWFRLLSNHKPQGGTVLVTTHREVLDELFDTFCGKRGAADLESPPACRPLASLPSLDALPREEFLRLLSDPEISDLLNVYWNALEEAILSPEDASLGEALIRAVGDVEDAVEGLYGELGGRGRGRAKLELCSLPGLSLGRIWERFDTGGPPPGTPGEKVRQDALKILLLQIS